MMQTVHSRLGGLLPGSLILWLTLLAPSPSVGQVITTSTGTSSISEQLKPKPEPTSSYLKVVEDPFDVTYKKLVADKPGVEQRQQTLLLFRYDLADHPIQGVTMSRGKPIQGGVRAKLPAGMTWQKLAEMTPDQIREQDLFPRGFLALPHANQAEGGQVFPKSTIDAINRQEGRDLTRFDLDFDIPEQFIPEFPPAIYLTIRPDLGDVSQGKLITLSNYYETFNGILNPKQIEGFRLLLTPFPQQQFNATADRRSVKPSQGVACFDCHINGHTNGAFHLVQDQRPEENRHRVDTPTLRGVHSQRLFGSQRALKTVEDFTQFEQLGAYFDGDPVISMKKGQNHLIRDTQVHFMAELQELMDFPPAPKLDVFGRLDRTKATEAELRGEAVFYGAGRCAECHPTPIYSDNMMHDLKLERFFKPQMVNGIKAVAEGPIKTFPLRGIKDSPPYFHDGRLLTLDDTVEFFNLVLGTKLSEQDKKDLVAFMLTL
jgi:cytochrome c peroxidase